MHLRGQAARHQCILAAIDSSECLSKPSKPAARGNVGRTDDMPPTAGPLYKFQKKGYRSMSLCRAQIECCTRWHPSTTYPPSTRGAGWITSQAQHLSIDQMTIHMDRR